MLRYPRDSRVWVAPFTRQLEGEELVVGRPETGVFLVLAAEAVEMLDELASGSTVGQAADRYRDRYGEEVDLEEFLAELETKGIVRLAAASGGALPEKDLSPGLSRRYHFSGLPQPIAARIFSRPVLAVCSGLILSALGVAMVDPGALPNWDDLFFPADLAVLAPWLIFLSLVSVFCHEMGHLIAAKAAGVSSRLGFGNRLWILVAETDMTGIWGVPRERRYLPLLAGPLVDATSASVLVLLLAVVDRGWIYLPGRVVTLVQAIVLIYFLGLVWQCYFFVRTDLYYVLANLFRCKNLMGDTEVFLRNQVARLLPWIHRRDQSHIPSSERRAIRAYSVIWLLGRILALALLFLVQLPLAWRYLSAFLGLSTSAPGTAVAAYSPLTVVLFLLVFGTGLWMWLRSLRRNWRLSRNAPAGRS